MSNAPIDSPTDWLSLARRLNALAQTGLTFGEGPYDRERYEEILTISNQMLSNLSGAPVEAIIKLLPLEFGYHTPKVDIRVVLLNERNELLLVREKLDEDKWTLPGGWADVGYTPFEVAEKEAREETGLHVRATRLLAVFDKKKHEHPPQPWYVYKFFILCEITGGKLLTDTLETGGADWFEKHAFKTLPLSLDRITLNQLETVYELAVGPDAPALCD